MQKVDSTNLHSHKYEPVEQEYHVRFNHGPCSGKGCEGCKHQGHTGSTYVYEGIPADKWAAIRDAESKGSAFNREIKAWEHPVTKESYKFSKRPA